MVKNSKVKIQKDENTIYNESLARMEKLIEMGFQGGFTMGLQQLDELLLTLKNK